MIQAMRRQGKSASLSGGARRGGRREGAFFEGTPKGGWRLEKKEGQVRDLPRLTKGTRGNYGVALLLTVMLFFTSDTPVMPRATCSARAF